MATDAQSLAEITAIWDGTAPASAYFGCLVCRGVTGLLDPDFCGFCLVKMGYATEEQHADARQRIEWAGLQERLNPGSPRPFPGDPPIKRPYTGPRGGSLFDKVKAHVSVADFAGQHTQLRRAGRGKLKGPCPIHQERSGSFYIFEDKKTWRCFGACADGGDVIKLAQLKLSLDTPKDAALHLAQAFGIPVNRSRNSHRPRKISFEVRS